MRLLRDLWHTSPRRALLVAVLIVGGAAGQALSLSLAGSVLVNRSVPLFAVLAVALVVAVVSDVLVGLVLARLTADWAAGVRRGLCRIAFGQDLPALENTPVGELLDRIDGDVDQVGTEIRNGGVRLAQSLAVAVLSILTAFVVWWPAATAMVLASVLLAVVLKRPVRRIGPLRIHEEEAWSDMTAVVEEGVHGQDDVRTSLAAPYVLQLWAQRSQEIMRRGRRVWRNSARVTMIAGAVIRTLIAGLAVGGAWALMTGHVGGARLTAVWLLALGFGGTLEQVTRTVPELQNAIGAWERVRLLRRTPQEATGGAAPSDGDLQVRDLTFRYAESGAVRSPALRDVTLTFTRGRSYALVGRTGSGKSTLAKLLTRAVDVPPGTVFLDGTDLNDLDVQQLRRWVAIVPQRTELLAGTLAENIALFDDELLPHAAGAVAELGLTGWVEQLPDGMQTRLGDGGHVLSAGQEQLIAFARILVRDPKIVILDEATARMDPVTETWVQRATDRLLAGRIGIIVAHRLSSVRHCDEVVVLADGAVVEAGPLATSRRFAAMLASGASPDPDPAGGTAAGTAGETPVLMPAGDPPPLPEAPPARTLREIFRLTVNDARFGMTALALMALLLVLGLEGAILPLLWSDVVDGQGNPLLPAAGVAAGLIVAIPALYYFGAWFPEWWVRQVLRINARLLNGQIGPRRISRHSPAEVVAQSGDTDRVVMLADNLVDHVIALAAIVTMTIAARSWVPAAFFAGTMILSGCAAALFGPRLERAAHTTVAARGTFATAVVSALSAGRTVKLSGATVSVLRHLARLDAVRNESQRREISIQVWARCTPSVLSGLLPIAAWGLYLSGQLPAAATLIAVTVLGSAKWFAWTTSSLVSNFPSARVWTRRTVEMCGEAAYSAPVPGVDLDAGTAPAPPVPVREPLHRLELDRFGVVHHNGTVGVRDVDLTVRPGELVLVVGPVGAGKSSLLRGLAGIAHHTGSLCWNGRPVEDPHLFLRPQQVGYVAQLPRVLSGTVADNIALGHDVDPGAAVSTAQLDHDLATSGEGLDLVIGHKGTRLSGGQLQRLALARALAPRTELLVADDVSSALDVTTEIQLWKALRAHGVTVVGSTSKRAALVHADRVLVLVGGRAVAQGRWDELEAEYGHLAG
ncbi:ABC transporter ATP-binding protein [Micromonospora sp. KC723]|uniref:ATP-binding cassette domain-containing protein n=1 Tax=Micromonospora sp. KC723 TaxID=2530381 RepID=UPI00104C3A09|nr:ABC transporter ATP-binding protein [Micromonospora sp. KC723]TDB78256.1 ABC transporter ATP-binding protein [Micromonospora sp. KC723]